MNELVSVIVPVYKSENYLCRCVDSILAQTYTNLEIILVDDGSPDNCGKICDEYATNDSRIKVIHKENGGVSSARNAGLNSFTGEYLTFIDSDDYVEKTYVESLIGNMDDKTDIVICMHRVVTHNQEIKQEFLDCNEITSVIVDENFDFMAKTVNFGILCKLFKKDVIRGLSFREDIYHGEDALFCAQAYVRTGEIKYIPDCLYSYVFYEESLSHCAVTMKSLTVLDAWNSIYQLFPESSISYNTCALEYVNKCFWIYASTLFPRQADKSLTNYVYSIICSDSIEKLYRRIPKPLRLKIKYNLLKHCKTLYDIVFGIKKVLQTRVLKIAD